MDTSTVYSAKAAHYAKHRWDYHADAVQTIIDTAQLTAASCVADIGAGTGIFTRHLAPLVARIYAVEPNAEMRQQAEQALAGFPSCVVLAGSAEDTGLPAAGVDLITVAQSIHWFEPEPARRELCRILRAGGWLAILRNIRSEDALAKATGRLMTLEYGMKQDISDRLRATESAPFYFGEGTWQRRTFPFSSQIDLDGFLGALHSVAATPDADDPHYHRLLEAARKVFAECSVDGRCTINGETELYIGQPAGLHAQKTKS